MIASRNGKKRYIRMGVQIILWMAFAVFAFGYFLGGFMGKWLVDSGRPKEGIAVYRLALRIFPWSAAGHNDLGLMLLKYSDVEGAVDELQMAVALAPDVPKLHNHLGFALFKNGDLDGAIQEYQEAVRLDSWHEEYRKDLQMAISAKKKRRKLEKQEKAK